MRGLRPSLGAAGSLLAAGAGLWLLASALLGFHAGRGGPAGDAPGVARLPTVTRPAKLTSEHTAKKAPRGTPPRRTAGAARRGARPRGPAAPAAPPRRRPCGDEAGADVSPRRRHAVAFRARVSTPRRRDPRS